MLHGAGYVLRTWLPRSSSWQRALVGLALLAVGAALIAFGHIREGLIGVVGLLILFGLIRNRVGRRGTRRRVPDGVQADLRGYQQADPEQQ